MKRILLFVIGLMVLPFMVNASEYKEPELLWDYDYQYDIGDDWEGPIGEYLPVIEEDDGVVIYDLVHLKKFSYHDGFVKKVEVPSDDYYMFDMVKVEDKYLVFGRDSEYVDSNYIDYNVMFLYDKDLNFIEKKLINIDGEDAYTEYVVDGVLYYVIKNDYSEYITKDDEIFKIDEELNLVAVSYNSIGENVFEKYDEYEELILEEYELPDDANSHAVEVSDYKVLDNGNVLVSYAYRCNYNDYKDSINIIGLRLYDKNNKVLFDKKIDDTGHVDFGCGTGLYGFLDYDDNYIYYNVLTSTNTKTLIYDYDGNLVDTLRNYSINEDTIVVPGLVIKNDKGLLVFYLYSGEKPVSKVRSCSPPSYSGLKVEFFGHKYRVTSKTYGNGEVKVLEIAVSGEEVTFKVIPNEGYEVDIIKVTDSKGNVVTFTDNVFKMPDSDVVIDVTFKKKVLNPNTADAMVIGICILIIVVGLIATPLSIKKYRWLK